MGVFTAAETDEVVLILGIEAEFAFAAGAGVVGVPGTTGDKIERVAFFAGCGCPFPQVAVHVIHAIPTAALFFAACTFGGFGVGVAFSLVVTAAIRVFEVILATTGGLPFVDGAEAFPGLFAEASRLLVRDHVFGDCVCFVGVFVGVDADGFAMYRDGVRVFAADVVACHVIVAGLPWAEVPRRILGTEENVPCFVVVYALRGFDGVGGVVYREIGGAFYFITLDFEFDGFIVAPWRGHDASFWRDTVTGAFGNDEGVFFRCGAILCVCLNFLFL